MPPAAGPGHQVWWLAPTQWIPHEGYVPSKFKNDIALIELAEDATLYPPTNNGAPLYQPAPLALGTGPSSTASSIGDLVIAGFGRTIPTDTTSAPLVANWASGIPSFGAASCTPFYPSQFVPLNAQKQLCFGVYPHTCQGDSGGAVLSGSKVYGIVSFGGIPCGNGPSVATYVPGYVDWINEQIFGPTPTPKPTAKPTPLPTSKPTAKPSAPITLLWELPPQKAEGAAAGISNCQGMTWSTAGPITSIELFVDGTKEATLPWPSDRGDSPGPVLSGFSGVVNWGRFSEGTHQAKLVVKDSKGNKKTETRTIKTVKVMPGVNFARDLSADDASCGWVSSDTFECTGLDFKQGSCSKTTTFKWSNGKQAMEVVEGCH